jgi:hypothetical protein
MGTGQFYMYMVRCLRIPCAVKEYVFSDINTQQIAKVSAASNAAFAEIWWFYPSANSQLNDKYVVFNYESNIWYYGTMGRTAWQDNAFVGLPIAAAQDGYLYYQEFGLNDGSGNLPAPLNAYIESSTVDIAEGDQFMFASRIIPDITFRNSDNSPTATFTIKARNYPGGSYFGASNNAVVSTAIVPVQLFTEQSFIRVRGRSVALRVESNQVNTAWRLGSPRLDVRPDGRR